MGEFRMPMLGADMEAGTLIEWLKQPGDPIKRGDIIAIVDTQKGAIEIEVFEDGVMDKVLVQPGTEVPVGTALAVIRATGAEAPGVTAAVLPHVRAAPAARQLAKERGIDLARVHGTGPGGAVTRGDVEAAAAQLSKPPAAPADRSVAMRSAIAGAMARSKREIPHYYLSTSVDMGAALAWLTIENDKRAVTDRLLAAALMIKSVALALREVPQLNGYWLEGTFRPGQGIHVGCAIALRGGGLVVPALRDTDRQDLGTLTHQLRDLVARARSGSLRSSELADPTITVTNLGDRGVEATFGVIYPPQVAIVGFGRVLDRATVVAGRIEARPVATVTLSADHRASDGHLGGLLLTAIDRLLQHPEML